MYFIVCMHVSIVNRRQCKLIWKGDQYYLTIKKKPPAQKLVILT